MQFFLELPVYEIDNEREITLNYKVFISLNYLMLLELSLLQWFFDFLISVHGSNLSLASCSSSVYSSVRWMKLLNIPKYCKNFLKILCLLLTKLLSSSYLIRYSIEVNGKNTIIMFTRRLYWSHYLNITVLVLVYNWKKGMNAWSEKI